MNAGNIKTQNNKNGDAAMPFMAFTNDSESIVVLKQFALNNSWAESIIHSGDIETAAQFLKTNHSPRVLFVDVTSQESTPAALDALADVCEPGTKVIVSGKINEYSFYCWLVDVGVSSYLLKPFTIHSLEAAYKKTTETSVNNGTPAAELKNHAKIITVIGARGGVGATTVCVNMAWIMANNLNHKTALLDFDPQFGTVSLALDLEPGKGLRDALEKPDRIDGLFIDRVMVKVDDNLSILSTEESIEDTITATEAAAEALFKQTQPKFSYIIIDLPRVLSPFTRYALAHSDHVICVTEYTIAGLRESLRYLEYCRDILKIAPPVFVANRVGLAGKHQMPKDEFEKGLGQKIKFDIPFVLDAHAAATVGEVLAETAKNIPATRVLHLLAEHFTGSAAEQKPKTKLDSILALLKGGK